MFDFVGTFRQAFLKYAGARLQPTGRKAACVMKPWSLGRGVGGYLAGERARAGPFRLGVLDSAVLVGIKHSPCKKKKGKDPIRLIHESINLSLCHCLLHYISLKRPSPPPRLSFCSSAAPGGPARDAFAVQTNRTDMARFDKSLLTGSTGSLTRVNCDCQPGKTLTLTPSPALMRGIQRVDFDVR